jgi:ribosomal protein S18 acetylase RimI-like enzyme
MPTNCLSRSADQSDAPSAPEPDLYYLQVPTIRRPVSQPIEFVTVQELLEDESLCKQLWELMHHHFRTRSKFLSIWPAVRYAALHRREATLAGFLLVSSPLNWQIDYVVVRDDMRHQGIAAALVHETVNQAFERKVPYVMLTSREGLRPLYQGQCGFTVVGNTRGLEVLGRSHCLAS